MLGEHEATVSRHLTRTRQAVRREVERWLRETARLGEAAVAECIGSALEDPGDLSLSDLLDDPQDRKIGDADRSTSERVP